MSADRERMSAHRHRHGPVTDDLKPGRPPGAAAIPSRAWLHPHRPAPVPGAAPDASPPAARSGDAWEGYLELDDDTTKERIGASLDDLWAWSTVHGVVEFYVWSDRQCTFLLHDAADLEAARPQE